MRLGRKEEHRKRMRVMRSMRKRGHWIVKERGREKEDGCKKA